MIIGRLYFLFVLLGLFVGGNTVLVQGKGKGISLSLLKKRAEQGDVRAQTELGDYYYQHIVYPGDDDDKMCSHYTRMRMFRWYTKAARQGYFQAQKKLAMIYSEIPCPDYDKGIYWLKKVGHKGDIEAQLRLAYVYHMGSGEEEDRKSIYWYKQAAKLNNIDAVYLLGKAYEEDKEYDKAIYWYKKAMNRGDSYGSNALCSLYFVLYNTNEDYKKSNDYKWLKASDPKLAALKDIQKSDKYCLIAAQQGNPDAQFSVGARYMTGRRVKKDEKKAMEYFKKACDQKDSSACAAYHGKFDFNNVNY